MNIHVHEHETQKQGVTDHGDDELVSNTVSRAPANCTVPLALVLALSASWENGVVADDNDNNVTEGATAVIKPYIGGSDFHKKQDHEEAMTCNQEAFRVYHSTLGPSHPAVTSALVCIGSSLDYKRSNLDSAMMVYRKALCLNRDAYGLHHHLMPRRRSKVSERS